MSRYLVSMNRLVIVILIASSSFLIGEKVMVSGLILNNDGQPLKKVNVSIRNLKDEILWKHKLIARGSSNLMM